MKNGIYCLSLWKSIHIDTDGYLTPCCLFVHPDDKKDRIEDIKSVEKYLIENHKKYRDMMRNNIWPDGCNQCKFAEQEGRISKRMSDLKDSNLLKYPKETPKLEYLQLKTGRICNLECTICTPSCSSKIALSLLKNNEISKEYYDDLNNKSLWATNLKEYEKIDSNKLIRIDVAGGEPLLNKEHFKWLDTFKNTDAILLYNTNGTIRPTNNELNIWKKFKGVRITFSIDSYEDKFEKLRVNAKWDEVIANYNFLRNILTKEFKNSNISIVYTIHKDNLNDIFEFVRKMRKYVDYDISNSITLNYLYYPESLAIHNLSFNELEHSLELYNKEIPYLKDSKLKTDITKIKNSLESFLGKNKKEESRYLNKDHRG